LTIELELVPDGTLCCAQNAAGAYSTDFSIQNARILCDVVLPDPTVQDQLSAVLLKGGALPMHFSSYNTVVNATNLNPPAKDAPGYEDKSQFWSVTISRAYSRIKDIWITFSSDAAYAANESMTEANCFLNWHGKDNGAGEGAAKYNKYGDAIAYEPKYGEGWRFQMTTGSLVYPDLPMQSMQEAWYQLSKTLGMHSSTEGTSIGSEWLCYNFVMSLDLEKMSSSPGAGMAIFTGLSTRNAGDTIRFAFDNVTPRTTRVTAATGGTGPAAVTSIGTVAWPTRMYTTIHMDLILELRAEGCILLD
jgi:hypothetical protein